MDQDPSPRAGIDQPWLARRREEVARWGDAGRSCAWWLSHGALAPTAGTGTWAILGAEIEAHAMATGGAVIQTAANTARDPHAIAHLVRVPGRFVLGATAGSD